MVINQKECVDCVVPIQCRNCGKLFDLNQDFKQHSDISSKEIMEEECGASELLCWECRDCD